MKATSKVPATSTDDLIDLDETARITGLRTRTVSQYVVLKRIPSVKVGTARLFSRRTITAWLKRRENCQRQLRELRTIDCIETPGEGR
jgi:excisionase family DNA binding protein